MAEPIFVINGFYMSMREKYTKDGASIHYLVVEWDSAKLSWADFRGKVLGATDPTTAEAGSLRRLVLDRYQELGLTSQPDVGDNGVHASASPFEALSERMNWCGAKLEADEFGQALLGAGITADTIAAWSKDPQVDFEGKKQSLFDLLEDLSTPECIAKAQAIAGVSGPSTLTKNSAFVFIKPHAVTPAVIDLVKKGFQEHGIAIVAEGALDNKIIESQKLIDNHYYAIANKASLTLPKDLNPPAPKQEEFAQLFGLKWEEALAKNVVFNAVDGCAQLGIDGATMDTVWGKVKKAGLLVKFGGGFYCGKIEKAAVGL
eukprot:TRINITY_DN10518_c0_g1_i1.p1 TRINITY_DN10518_c0_g1~~TRINITY_DN10518_c0_g1_i1.p1  ORF type:complete len:317 (-),score=102.35 TRINITY_DN10518_c0_g1_i1:264-1214(-)